MTTKRPDCGRLSDLAPSQLSSARDIFAMKEELSPEGEALWNDVMALIERERHDPNLGRARDFLLVSGI